MLRILSPVFLSHFGKFQRELNICYFHFYVPSSLLVERVLFNLFIPFAFGKWNVFNIFLWRIEFYIRVGAKFHFIRTRIFSKCSQRTSNIQKYAGNSTFEKFPLFQSFRMLHSSFSHALLLLLRLCEFYRRKAVEIRIINPGNPWNSFINFRFVSSRNIKLEIRSE